MSNPPFLTVAPLQVPGVAHGFFGRKGGVSHGLYATLNGAPASGDDRGALAENRRRISQTLGGYPLLTLTQYHSAVTITVTAPWTMEESPRADALVSAQPGLILGVNTADCAPVLLLDPVARVIGAAHAGWKGALGGVCESAIDAMVALGAVRQNIRAAIGPCIGQSNYEVGQEFRDAFPDAAAAFFVESERPGHFRFALEDYVAQRLALAGIGTVAKTSRCTFGLAEEYFSFRRATLAGEPDYGREVSAILLLP